MSDSQFGVDPDTLTELAGRFENESKTLSGQGSDFVEGASDVGQAYGLLGVCDGAAEKYMRLLNSTCKVLGQLSQVLENDGRGLRQNAANYMASDRTAQARMQSVAARLGEGS